MRSWAIIVGINDYPAITLPRLRGAVADALDFADWALHPQGGAVKPDDLYLWVNPAPPLGLATPAVAKALKTPSGWTSAGQVRSPEDRAPYARDISETAYVLAQAARAHSRDTGEVTRLCIFLAGHGVQTRTAAGLPTQTCLICGDFADGGVGFGLVPSEDLRMAMLTHGFGEVLMFLDCCRVAAPRFNTLAQTLALPSGQFPDEPTWGTGLAAANNSIAFETPRSAPSRGAFSRVLLQGLRRARDPETQALTVYSLESYVTSQIGDEVKPEKQTPYFNGEPTMRNVTIVTGPQIQASSADIRISFGANKVAPGTGLVLKNDTSVVRKDLVAGTNVTVAAPIGRLYSIETPDGAFEYGFVHNDPAGSDVQL